MLSLAGEWQVELDPGSEGLRERWFSRELHDRIQLPGTLDLAGLGQPNPERSDEHLHKPLVFEGAAWYRRTINVPDAWRHASVFLTLERTKVTQVWLNGVKAGGSDVIYARQVFDLTPHIRAGGNTLVICVNNDPSLVPVAGSHAYSVDTQTNWNGILGRIELEARNPVHLAGVRATPDVAGKSIHLAVRISAAGAAPPLELAVDARLWNVDADHEVPRRLIPLPDAASDGVWQVVLPLGPEARTWSEFSPALYRLGIDLRQSGRVVDSTAIDVGLREFRTRERQFTINGDRIFLRGELDGLVFPLTAHPPMDADSWLRVFRIAQSYGINHYRFHSCTPPEAAFAAADRCGLYVQTELPVWWGFDAANPGHVEYLTRLGREILDDVGNHASLVMFTLGNEIAQDRGTLRRMVAELRAHDPRPLYAQGSNNHLSDPAPGEDDDFFVSFRTGPATTDWSTDIRATMSFVDSIDEGGLLNSRRPSTDFNYARAIRAIGMPVVGFEVGQYQVYPDFSELPKYTGVLKPLNLELFRDRLAALGRLDEAPAYARASGALAVLGYRAELEAALRTPAFAGLHLLNLQDYPGQGTALIGLLDAFMDSKGLVDPAEFRQWCDDAVLLVEHRQYCWTTNETYEATLKFANYGPRAFQAAPVEWTLASEATVVASGRASLEALPHAGLVEVGAIRAALAGVVAPARLELTVSVAGTHLRTRYPLWVYGDEPVGAPAASVRVAGRLDEELLAWLAEGGRVVLFPRAETIAAHSVPTQFVSEFWNWAMFSAIARQQNRRQSPGTMGILADPAHPALAAFPTESHTNFQWWPMVARGRALILDTTRPTYRPIVGMVDNINRNHKLGLVFEFAVGRGALLVCTADLPALAAYPEARQLHRSLLEYAASDRFRPDTACSTDDLRALGLVASGAP